MREFQIPKYWKAGNDIILLSEVVAVWTFKITDLYIYFKNSETIKITYSDGAQRDQTAKDLSSALERYLLESRYGS